MSKLESVQKSVIINHISMNKLNTLIYLTISDFRSDKSVHEICFKIIYGALIRQFTVMSRGMPYTKAAIFANSVCWPGPETPVQV